MIRKSQTDTMERRAQQLLLAVSQHGKSAEVVIDHLGALTPERASVLVVQIHRLQRKADMALLPWGGELEGLQHRMLQQMAYAKALLAVTENWAATDE